MEAALYPAAALEVYHNWTLVHDDIIDQDAFRRNVPTTHYSLAGLLKEKYRLSDSEAARQGRDFAMLCGDVQQAWANDLLMRGAGCGTVPEVILAMSRRLQYLGNKLLVSGEALDMELALRNISEIRPEEVVNMLRLKTGALLQLSAEFGAMTALNCADYTNEKISKLGKFAMACGVAFQLQDDYLGVFGDERTLGKAVGGDLREAKPTVLLLTALQKADAVSKAELLKYLRRESYTQEDLDRVRTIMTECKAAETVKAMAESYSHEALDILTEFEDSEARRILFCFVDYMTSRSH